jgi:hypothetical protein
MLVSRTATWSVDAGCAVSGVEVGMTVGVQVDGATEEGEGDSASTGEHTGVSCWLMAGVAEGAVVALARGSGVVADGEGAAFPWQPHNNGSRHKTNKPSGQTKTRFIAQRHLGQGYRVYVSTTRMSHTRKRHSGGRRSLKLGPLLQLTPRCPAVCAIIGPKRLPGSMASESRT